VFVLATFTCLSCSYWISPSHSVIVYRCDGTYSITFDYGVIVECEVENRGSACGSATVRLVVEQAGLAMDQKIRSVYLCPGDRTRVKETLWGAQDNLNPTICRCQVL
jgi:hypothetical protein